MLDGLDGFDYIWLIWGFSLNREASSSKVRPPRLGGNEKMGVFATRSPYRPNPLGLSSVRIASIDAAAGRIEVLGADLVDGTPIYDIKPYLEYADSHSGIRSGFASSAPERKLKVKFAEGITNGKGYTDDCLYDPNLLEILSLDPRPAYQDDPDRIYGLSYNGCNIRFKVAGDELTVVGLE